MKHRRDIEGTVYLLHFDQPYRHARHYMGWTEDLQERLERHLQGRGARLIEVVVTAGIAFELARTWPGTRQRERQLKLQGGLSRLCPICRKAKHDAREQGGQMDRVDRQEIATLLADAVKKTLAALDTVSAAIRETETRLSMATVFDAGHGYFVEKYIAGSAAGAWRVRHLATVLTHDGEWISLRAAGRKKGREQCGYETADAAFAALNFHTGRET